jgi:uncharacterized membrane protein YdjX (TVP38/TMEM64 family)
VSAAARSPWARGGALVVLVLLSVAAATAADLPSTSGTRAWLYEVGPEAWLAVALGQAVALMTPVPRSALSVLVGAVAGFWAGLALVVVGGLLGGLGGFQLSRWLGREAAMRVAGDRLRRIDRLFTERGFLAVLMARVMPVVPFMLVSYAAGLSGVRLRPYALGTAVGLLPGSVTYVAIGSSTALIASWLTPQLAALLAVTLALRLLGVGIVGATARRCTAPRSSVGARPGGRRAPPDGR